MITNELRKNILTYTDVMLYIQTAFRESKRRRWKFKQAIKDMYDLLCERELDRAKKAYKRRQVIDS